ncbi:MAG TPA: ATP-binding protein, partial [Prolixibacteraceae bacterium]|nr:ATP-binding protein [Prolixibacteraceae bacterium]
MIEYGYELRENSVRFYILDTGSGIDATDQDKIFDNFYKSMKEKMKLYRGTGIGLAISKRLVEQMGGVIWVKSTLNVGSEFSFTLPIN